MEKKIAKNQKDKETTKRSLRTTGQRKKLKNQKKSKIKIINQKKERKIKIIQDQKEKEQIQDNLKNAFQKYIYIQLKYRRHKIFKNSTND